MRYRTWTFLIILLISSVSISGQNLDSLDFYFENATNYFDLEQLDSATKYSQFAIKEYYLCEGLGAEELILDDSYYMLGRSLSKLQKHNASEQVWQEFLEHKSRYLQSDDESVLKIRCDLAATYFFANQEMEMERQLDTIDQFLSTETHSKELRAFAKLLKGQYASFSNNYAEGLIYLEQAKELFLNASDTNSVELIRCVVQMGLNYYYLGKNEKAIELTLYARSKLISKYGKRTIQSEELLNNVGLYYLYLGKIDQAKSYLEDYIKAIRSDTAQPLVKLAPAYINLGLISSSKGNTSRSIYYFLAAEELWSKAHGPKHGQLIYAYINLASQYFKNNDNTRAKNYISLLDSMNIEPNGQWKQIFLAAKLIEGQLLTEDNEHIDAIEVFREIDQVHATDPAIDPFRRGQNLTAMCKSLIASGNTSEAQSILNQVIKTLGEQRYGKENLFSVIYELLANIAMKNGDWTEAKSMSDQAMAVLQYDFGDKSFDKVENMVELIERLGYRLEIQYQYYLNDSILGRDELNEIMQLVKIAIPALSRRYGDENEKVVIKANIRSVSEKLMQCYLILMNEKTNDSVCDDILATMEWNKNASLVAERVMERTDMERLVDANLLDEDSKIRNELKRLRLVLAQIDSEQQINDPRKGVLLDSILLLAGIHDALFLKLKQESPAYFTAIYGPELPKIGQLQESILSSEDVLLQYFFGEDAVYRLAVSQQQVKVDRITEIEEINSLTHNLVKNYKNPGSNIDSTDISACRLYNLLIPADITSFIKLKNILIINDGISHYLPFETLKESCVMSAGDYLSANYNISYHVSSSLLIAQTTNERSSSATFSGFAAAYDFETAPEANAVVNRSSDLILYKLPEAMAEVKSVAKLVGGNYYLKENATETNFKMKAEKMDIIHLSLHGYLSDYFPMESGLLFHNADSLNDGILKAGEIYGLDLKADLAVLSACETGVGELRRGEGLQSIARAFAYAGVNSTVMSLWKVPDKATKKIMVEFYRGLKHGLRKDEALRQAKLTYLENTIEPQERHPYYWAGFVIQGNTDPIHFNNNSMWSYLIIGGALLLALFLIYVWRKKM